MRRRQLRRGRSPPLARRPKSPLQAPQHAKVRIVWCCPILALQTPASSQVQGLEDALCARPL
eukprot:CAMPEP_0170626662 /NCGR_PEP_ID=MMETSP0224-20130122/31491_1 /TAXON_ID=285029 /ORGANISM="Togula jolla, Strain CCCM 725" /LENGTH=61 /DNA_ID=CAMNT_0010953477 /DNA_START=351 /DNA_END=533 /DNA_ORIENTATION=-